MAEEIENDKITVEELKMFVGTGLMCDFEYLDGGYGVAELTLDEIEENIAPSIKSIPEIFIDFKPKVRPMSGFTIEDYIKLDGIDGEDVCIKLSETYQKFNKKIDVLYLEKGAKAHDIIETIYTQRPSMNRFRIVNDLAKLHFDIFNWLGRGLAKEIGE